MPVPPSSKRDRHSGPGASSTIRPSLQSYLFSIQGRERRGQRRLGRPIDSGEPCPDSDGPSIVPGDCGLRRRFCTQWARLEGLGHQVEAARVGPHTRFRVSCAAPGFPADGRQVQERFGHCAIFSSRLRWIRYCTSDRVEFARREKQGEPPERRDTREKRGEKTCFPWRLSRALRLRCFSVLIRPESPGGLVKPNRGNCGMLRARRLIRGGRKARGVP
jgi:hypothetical protein